MTQLKHHAVVEAVASGAATRDKKTGNVLYSVVFGGKSPEHMHKVTDEELAEYEADVKSNRIFELGEIQNTIGFENHIDGTALKAELAELLAE